MLNIITVLCTYMENNHYLDLEINSRLARFLLKILIVTFPARAFELLISRGLLRIP